MLVMPELLTGVLEIGSNSVQAPDGVAQFALLLRRASRYRAISAALVEQ